MWKENWQDTKRRFCDWWNRKGLLVGSWGGCPHDGPPHEDFPAPAAPDSLRNEYTDAEQRARRNHHRLSHQLFLEDTLPISATDIGPGSLALFLGSEPGFSPNTVWFEPCIHECDEPEELPPFEFDPSNPWWNVTESTLRASAALGRDNYFVGCPDLVENIDVLASLRDSQTLLMDMVIRPEWVERKVAEINHVWFDAYQRIYDIIKQPDGSSAFGAFRLWGPGKTAKVQCDASVMFSPDMFQRFVVPGMAEQCRWLDNSMYHLDGTQAMCHLDALLEIDPLDAIEWTPQAGIDPGGSPRWYDLYRRILDAGKSVQVVGVKMDELIPLLDAIGSEGVYVLMAGCGTLEFEKISEMVAPYR